MASKGSAAHIQVVLLWKPECKGQCCSNLLRDPVALAHPVKSLLPV